MAKRSIFKSVELAVGIAGKSIMIECVKISPKFIVLRLKAVDAFKVMLTVIASRVVPV